MYIIYKYDKKYLYTGVENMEKVTRKITYFLILIVLLLGSISFGYFSTVNEMGVNIDNSSLIEYAKDYVFHTSNDMTVTASTKTYDISVVYEDNYLICGDKITNSKVLYGTTMDKVKEDEKAYQEEKGLMYEIKNETVDSITYTRNINENCPNHFLVIYEE